MSDDVDRFELLDEASIVVFRAAVARAARATGLDDARVARAELVATELAANALVHGRRGLARVGHERWGAQSAVVIDVCDEGPGIADPARALLGAGRVSGSLGIGLAAAHEHADELDMDVRLGESTRLVARVFDSYPSRRRVLGVFGRPRDRGDRSGDCVAFARNGSVLSLVVADGLGHGAEARAAADVVASAALAELEASGSLVDALHAADGAARGTRGAACAVIRVEDEQHLRVCLAGDVSVSLVSADPARRFAPTAAVVGAFGPRVSLREWSAELGRWDVLVAHSDGVSLGEELALGALRRDPLVAATRLVEDCGRADDDAVALVLA